MTHVPVGRSHALTWRRGERGSPPPPRRLLHVCEAALLLIPLEGFRVNGFQNEVWGGPRSSVGRSGSHLGPQGRSWEPKSELDTFSHKKQKIGARQGSRKNKKPNTPGLAQCRFETVKTIFFEGFTFSHLSGFGIDFSSIFDPNGIPNRSKWAPKLICWRIGKRMQKT